MSAMSEMRWTKNAGPASAIAFLYSPPEYLIECDFNTANNTVHTIAWGRLGRMRVKRFMRELSRALTRP